MAKKIIFISGAIILTVYMFTIRAWAREQAAKNIRVSFTNTYVSRYIWRGQDVYADNDGAYQPDANISFENFIKNADINFGLWGSFSLNKGHELADELDYTLSISPHTEEAYSLSFGYTYYDYSNADKYSDVYEPWVSFTLNRIPHLPLDISFNIFAGYDFAAASGGPDEGWYYSWGFSIDLPLPKSLVAQKDQFLSLDITNWGEDGVADLKPSFVYATEFSLSTTYTFKYFSISPSINYTLNHKDEINSGDDEVWVGLSFEYTF